MPKPGAHDLLLAETEAFPLVSMAAYRASTLTLRRTNMRDEDAPTAELGRALEDRLRVHAGGLSLDVLRQLRFRSWFRDPPNGAVAKTRTRTMREHLDRVAQDYLALRGRRPVLNPSYADEHDAGVCEIDRLLLRPMRYRWLTLRVPPDLLVAALAARSDTSPDSPFVDLVTPHLTRVLEEPVADTHLHVGQGTTFGDVWRSLMAQLASGYDSDAITPLTLENKVGVPDYAAWGDPKRRPERYLGALLLAGIVRLWLARFLADRRRGFSAYLRDLADTAAEDLVWPEAHAVFRDALKAIGDMERLPELPRLRKLYVGLTSARVMEIGMDPGPVMPEVHQTAEQVLRRDPAALWLSDDRDPEMGITRRGLAYLAAVEKDESDPLFARAFWQYQRLRAMTYGFVTQDPGVGGLDWFQRFSKRLGPLRRPLERSLVTSTHVLQSTDVALASFEVRTTPESDWSRTWRGVRDMARQLHAMPERPEAGMVLHFAKGRGDHDEPDGARWAYGAWSTAAWKQARAVESMLDELPETLVLLRGLDVASTELSMPLWPVLRPILHLRDASRRVAERLSHEHPAWSARPLRVTCHAGEDFRRLSEGLRRVHELIRFGMLSIGDRVGHGLALGIDPEKWAAHAPCIEQPQIERLEDLLWELDLYNHGAIAPIAARVERARFEAQRIARQVHGRQIPVEILLRAREYKHDPARLASMGFPTIVTDPACADEAEVVLAAELRRAEVFNRGQVPIEVGVEPGEVQFLRAAGDFVRRELTRLEITVETNPSSNLLIGRYEAIDDHPVFRMFPRRGRERPGEVPVLVSINVDDPVAFASRMADEYAHVYFAMLRADVPAQEALDWLARVRKNGYDSRFTLKASRKRKVLARIAR